MPHLCPPRFATQIVLASLFLLLGACSKEESKTASSRRSSPAVFAPPPTPIATVQRLTAQAPEVRQHQISNETLFPKALDYLTEVAKNTPDIRPHVSKSLAPTRGLSPDAQNKTLVSKDWVGVILRPLNTNADLLHTMQVELEAVEAHPLEDGSIRIWVRVRNRLDRPIRTEIGCSFKTLERPEPPRTKFFELNVEGQSTQDIFFVSPHENVMNYTILIRGENTVRSLASY